MKKNYMNTFYKHIMLICLLVVLGGREVLAGNSTYPFRTTVIVDQSPTGAGKVYASYDGSAQTATTTTRDYDETISDANTDGTTATVTLSATANTGYRFLRWEDGNGSVISRTATTTATQEYDITGASRTPHNRWWDVFRLFTYYTYNTQRVFTYTAYFALQGSVIARVATGQESIGSADILEEVLTPGAEITLKASNINGSELNGWAFDHWELNGEEISTSKQLKVRVPTTSQTLTYIAHFVKADTEYYCFIRNKATGNYLKLSDQKAYTKPSNNNNPVGSFNGSFTLVSDEQKAITDPGCVFTLEGTSKNNGINKATLVSQGVSVGYLQGSKIINDNDYGLTISPASSGAYYISAHYEAEQQGTTLEIPLYFRDNNGTPDLAGARSATSEWEILELSTSTLSQQYFGLAPNEALKKGDKYYTTLYTTFPYQLQSGTAYYVNHESIVPYGDESEGKFRVVCQEVANGKVPANQAVIIECEGLYPEDNKIVPLPQSESNTTLDGNFLRGNIAFKDGAKSGNGKIYVLSVGQKTGLGFYKLKSETPVTDNKAYTTLTDEQQNFAKKATFSIGDYTTSIQEDIVLAENVAGKEIFDLQGRRVNNPKQGIYIVNGKKYIIK